MRSNSLRASSVCTWWHRCRAGRRNATDKHERWQCASAGAIRAPPRAHTRNKTRAHRDGACAGRGGASAVRADEPARCGRHRCSTTTATLPHRGTLVHRPTSSSVGTNGRLRDLAANRQRADRATATAPRATSTASSSLLLPPPTTRQTPDECQRTRRLKSSDISSTRATQQCTRRQRAARAHSGGGVSGAHNRRDGVVLALAAAHPRHRIGINHAKPQRNAAVAPRIRRTAARMQRTSDIRLCKDARRTDVRRRRLRRQRLRRTGCWTRCVSCSVHRIDA